MSHKSTSACISPPDDYTPKSRPPQGGKFRERGRGGGGHRGGYKNKPGSNRPTTFTKDGRLESSDQDYDKKKYQPKDRFYKNEDDDYFALVDDDQEDRVIEDEEDKEDNNNVDGDEDEDDPLDAYMKSLESDKKSKVEESIDSNTNPGIQKEVEKKKVQEINTALDTEKKAIRLDIDETDDIEESYYQYVEQTRGKKSATGDSLESDVDSDERQNLVEYDNDGNILSVKKIKRDIEPLPSIDHSTIEYEKFQKVFYHEHSEIEKLTTEQGEELRSKLDIKVSGNNPPKPVCSFAHFKFDEQLMKVIRRSEYTQPTPIQAQAIPAALLGRNIIGIAMTGSGKTAAYLWPMIVHIMGQPDLKRGDGPIGLILVPTRELALQVYGEAKKFSTSYRIATVCAYGGGSKYEQSRDLEAGAEIVVATPGRMIDLIKLSATNLRRVTYLVLDEADRFFEMGFEAQVRSICDQIRPDRQTLLFSATFKKKIEQLARTVTDDPVKIIQRALGEANEDVNQHVIVMQTNSKKWDWLTSKLVEFTSAGSVLIFVTRIINAEELNKNLLEFGKDTLLLHGDMEQSERNRVITLFKRKEKDIMIATDVAARGLDISHIRTVINYDVARDIDTHIHRVGRTGRAGLKGDAYTLVTIDKDKEFAGQLVKNLEASNQPVPEELFKLAMQSHTFRKSRAVGSTRHHHHNNRAQHHSSGAGCSTSTGKQQQHYHHHNQDVSSSSSSSHRSYDRPSSNRNDQNYSHQHHKGYRDRSPHHYHQHYKSSSSSSRNDYNYSFNHQRQGSSSSYDDHRKKHRWH